MHCARSIASVHRLWHCVPFPHPIVLQPPVNVVWALVINIDGIKLADIHRIVFHPMRPVIVGNIHPAVIPVDQMPCAVRVDPQRVMIGMDVWFPNGCKGFSSVI